MLISSKIYVILTSGCWLGSHLQWFIRSIRTKCRWALFAYSLEQWPYTWRNGLPYWRASKYQSMNTLCCIIFQINSNVWCKFNLLHFKSKIAFKNMELLLNKKSSEAVISSILWSKTSYLQVFWFLLLSPLKVYTSDITIHKIAFSLFFNMFYDIIILWYINFFVIFRCTHPLSKL